LIGETRDRILPENPGDILKKDYEYKRDGSVSVFCAVEPKIGKYMNKVTERRCGSDFAKFIKSLSEIYRYAEKIVLVMDNLATHKEKHLIGYYGDEVGKEIWDRFEIHYTPKHGSWLNQAEIAIGMYSRQCLGDGRIGSLDNLKLQTTAWNKRANKMKVNINWRFTKSKARKSLGYVSPKHSEKLI